MSSEHTQMTAPDQFGRLDALWRSFDEVKAALLHISAAKIEEKIDSFEPAVTLVGQIKSGKTALINALVGQPDLLPSDVNPWTSVVTSLHLNSRRRPEGTRALFRFFDGEEWDRLISTGGRLGELAQRAGFEAEKDEVHNQVKAMREKSFTRLGKRFEMLFGESHNYESFDKNLIDRYVCHGGFDENDDVMRFADVTKQANLYLDLEGYPSGLCLRDTPGVNDTFMMREQITINAIRDSRLCVVVLSAHQALSTMDMALMRLVANVDAREIILFVNRIDELNDPAVEVPLIKESLRETIKKHDIAGDVEIVFGSAFWAHHALNNDLDDLSSSSRTALEKWKEKSFDVSGEAIDDEAALAWKLSGVPALHGFIADRIAAGPGKSMLKNVRDEVNNLLISIEVNDRQLGLSTNHLQSKDINQADLAKQLDALEKKILAAMKQANTFEADNLEERMRSAQGEFAEQAVGALTSHLETYGDTTEIWQYNPSSLRVRLRSTYQSFGSNVGKSAKKINRAACREYEKLYVEVFGLEAGKVRLSPPGAVRLAPPAAVGKTIALDLNVSWWKKWWRGLRGSKAVAKRYAELVNQETDSILSELTTEMVPKFLAETENVLKEFLEAQRHALMSLAERSSEDGSNSDSASSSSKVKALELARTHIDNLAA